MTNLFEILKNAPENIVLYDTVFGSCNVSTKIEINGNENVEAIGCFHTDQFTQVLTLNKYGKAWVNDYTNEEGCCLLFPSKDNHSWNNWQKHLIKSGMFVRHKDYDFTLLKQDNNFVDHCGTTYELDDDELSFASENDIEYFKNSATINGFEIKDGKLINVRETPESQQEEKKEEEYEFEPFQKVLVRDTEGQSWKCDIFSNKIDADTIINRGNYYFKCIGNCWKQCIPYNETTKYLIGTTLPYEVYVDIPSSEDVKYNIEIRDVSKCQSKLQFTKIIFNTYKNSLLESKNLVDHVCKTELPYILPFPKLRKNEAIVLVMDLKHIGVEAKFI